MVGVVSNTHHSSLEEPPQPKLYIPYAKCKLQWWMFVVVRGGPHMAGLPERLKHELRAIDASLFVDQSKLLKDSLRSTITNRQEMLALIGSFALLALLLTICGMYGVLANFVAQRTREIGIRMAMGANANSLVKMVIRQTLWVVLIGIAAGISAAIGLSRYIAS
jgi:putative ABC transport system permease protein